MIYTDPDTVVRVPVIPGLISIESERKVKYIKEPWKEKFDVPRLFWNVLPQVTVNVSPSNTDV